MEHRHVVAEPHAEPTGKLRRKRDLRDERQRPAALPARVGDRLHVHVRLPAAGYAVQEERGESALIQRLSQFDQRLALRRRFAHGAAAAPRGVHDGRCPGGFAAERDQATPHELPQVRARSGERREQLLHG